MNNVSSVKVRMYRQLLGDCFLITIEGKDRKARYILIDCGILQNVEGDKARMQAIAENIRSTTDGFVDLLVITHQHHDHISGFAHAKEILLDPDKMKFGEVWMGWTEDPDDVQAKKLDAQFNKRKLAMASLAMAMAEHGQDALLNEVTLDLQNFIGPIEPATSGLSAAPEGRLTGARVMEELKKAGEKAIFHEPGKVMGTPGTASLPAAILAPPRAESRLFKDLPTKGEGKETYLGEQYLQYSLLGVDGGECGQKLDRRSPFAQLFSEGLRLAPTGKKWASARGSTRRWIQDHYYADEDAEGRPQSYRTIDDVWANSAASYALDLDSDTNNTSLVIAFRLPNRKFLLFAADAQVGNWLSWHDQSYDFGDESLSASDILGRTILYKVGHHGSHNATLRAKGLELMVDKTLTAMISTVETIAKEQGKPPGWLMPFEGILKELLVRCDGRVLRGDRKWADDPDTMVHRPQPEFEGRLDDTEKLYVELQVYSEAKSRSRKRGAVR